MTSPTTDRRMGLVGNIATKAPVTVLAASNITLSGEQTIDGVAVLTVNAAGVADRVLCTGQTTASENGIWDVSTGAWTRSLDANGNYDLRQGSTVLVNRGTTYASTYWKIDTADPITIGTTSIAWSRALASSIDMQYFLQAGTGAVQRGAQDKMREIVSVKDFGATGDGVTDDTAAFQAVLSLAKGADDTGLGRSVFAIYVPNPAAFYKITDTLVIDGTHGLIIYGDGAKTSRSDYPVAGVSTAAIRWFGSSANPVFQLFGRGSGAVSNPNFDITIRDLTINGYGSATLAGTESIIPAGVALAGIYLGPLAGVALDTLNRNITIENVAIDSCRFGIYSGNPSAGNTDHAQVRMRNLYIDTCAQFSVHWGTGNAVGTLENLFTTTSGWVNDVTNAADTYAAAKGANVYVQAGVLNISNYISGSPLPSKTADIYQASGQVNISQTWQENGSYAFYQASASQNGGVYMPSVIEGINHYSGSFTRATNPDSLAITSPGTTVSGCRVYGDVSVLSGLGGKPVFSGINFIDAAAVYKGSGIDTQRSLIDIGHVGNYAQVALGGRNSGMTLADVGYLVPQLLSMGAGTSADAVAILQALGAASGSSGFTMTLEPTNGGLNVFVNCYVYDAAYNFRAHKAGSAFRVILGGGTNALKIYAYDFADTTTSVAYTSFVDLGGVKVGGGAGYYTEAVLMPPLRAAAPTYSSGNWWEGGIYYNTTTNKLQVNTGAGTWETITST